MFARFCELPIELRLVVLRFLDLRTVPSMLATSRTFASLKEDFMYHVLLRECATAQALFRERFRTVLPCLLEWATHSSAYIELLPDMEGDLVRHEVRPGSGPVGNPDYFYTGLLHNALWNEFNVVWDSSSRQRRLYLKRLEETYTVDLVSVAEWVIFHFPKGGDWRVGGALNTLVELGKLRLPGWREGDSVRAWNGCVLFAAGYGNPVLSDLLSARQRGHEPPARALVLALRLCEVESVGRLAEAWPLGLPALRQHRVWKAVFRYVMQSEMDYESVIHARSWRDQAVPLIRFLLSNDLLVQECRDALFQAFVSRLVCETPPPPASLVHDIRACASGATAAEFFRDQVFRLLCPSLDVLCRSFSWRMYRGGAACEGADAWRAGFCDFICADPARRTAALPLMVARGCLMATRCLLEDGRVTVDALVPHTGWEKDGVEGAADVGRQDGRSVNMTCAACAPMAHNVVETVLEFMQPPLADVHRHEHLLRPAWRCGACQADTFEGMGEALEQDDYDAPNLEYVVHLREHFWIHEDRFGVANST